MLEMVTKMYISNMKKYWHKLTKSSYLSSETIPTVKTNTSTNLIYTHAIIYTYAIIKTYLASISAFSRTA